MSDRDELGNDTITVLNAPLTGSGRYGGQARDWGAAVPTVVTGCSVQPYPAGATGNAETIRDREFTNTHLRLFAPQAAPLLASSRVRFGAETFDVDGEPGRWRDLDGVPDHLEVALKRLAG